MTTKSKIAIGTTVKVLDTYTMKSLRGRIGTVVAYSEALGIDVPLVDFGTGFAGHKGNGWDLTEGGPLSASTGWWIDANEIAVHAKEPTAPMTKSVLDLLRRKGALTSMEAQGVLRCRQLPARILELKRLGHRITTEMKFDPTGQKYARYHLQQPIAA